LGYVAGNLDWGVMADYIEGDGTPENPLRPAARARGILKALIASPRAALSDIYPRIAQEGGSKPQGVTKGMLGDDGIIGRLIRYRVALSPMRHAETVKKIDGDPSSKEVREVAGMCFIAVKAVGKAYLHRESFFEMLDTIGGIIEWDEIGGDGQDYLIRIAHQSESPKTDQIVRMLTEHPIVESTRTMQIRRSRVLDNFEPDDFLCFADE
jgi:hypothetical protein